jgi:hypothetical protein
VNLLVLVGCLVGVWVVWAVSVWWSERDGLAIWREYEEDALVDGEADG